MAINATFRGDFTSFVDAVKKAEVELKTFEDGAAKVIPTMTRLGNSLSGTKLIQDATAMAKVVQDVGGVSTLTEKELQRVGAQAQEAAEKMRKLGIGVPENLQKIITAAEKMQTIGKGVPENLQKVADTAQKTSGYFSSLGSEIVKTATAFVTAQGVINLATKGFDLLKDAVVGSIDFASKLDDMSKATNIGVEALQELGFAGKRVGLSLDDIGGIVGQLAKRLATGDSSAAGAVQALGIDLNALKAQKPEEQFIQIAEAVGRIADPLTQAGIGTEIFGKKYQDVLKLANDNLRETMQAAKESGAVLGGDAVKSLDAFGDKVGDIMQRVKVLTASALTPFVDKLMELMAIGERAQAVTFVDPQAEASFKKYGAAAVGTKDALKGFGMQLEITGKAAKDLAAGHGNLISSTDLINSKLKALRADALMPLSAIQKSQIVELAKWGQSEKEIAGLVGASESAVHRYAGAHKELQAATKQTAEEEKRWRSELAKGEHAVPMNVGSIGFVDTASNLLLEQYLATAEKLVDVQHQAFGSTLGWTSGLEKLGQTVLPITNDELKKFDEMIQFVGPTLDQAAIGVLTFSQSLEKGMARVAKELPRMLADAIRSGDWTGSLTAIGSQIGQTLGAAIGGPLGAAIGSFLPQIGQGIANFFGNLFGANGSNKLLERVEANVKAAKAFKKASDDAADAAAKIAGEASSRFGPSKPELAAMAHDAAAVYKFMLDQGTYTAEQLAAAFKASQEAQAASLGINTEATKKHLDALQKGLDDLTSKRDQLWQQVSAEAPEEVMGVIEAAQRTQLGVLDDQIAAQKLAIEKEAADAADALKRALEAIDPDPIKVPYTWTPTNDFPTNPGGERPEVYPQATGGDYMVQRPTLFLAGEAGAERATFTPAGQGDAGNADLAAEVAALSNLLSRLPRTISRAIRDGLVGMGG